MKETGVIILFLLISCFSNAQISTDFGLLPSVVVGNKIDAFTSVRIGLESRNIYFVKIKETEGDFGFQNILQDLSIQINRKFGFGKSVTIGVTNRFKNGNNAFRLIQQLNWVNKKNNKRIAQRVGIDQTFEEGEATKFRLRYRYFNEKSLNGLRIDVRDFYVKLGGELLGEWDQSAVDFEFRILPFVGYEIGKSTKVEIGLDTRVKGFISDDIKLSNWLRMAYFQNLNIGS